MAKAPRFLFIPVSGATGSGEYTRCLMLADAVRVRWPDAPIHFLMSAEAPYAQDAPYLQTLFPGSPTLHDAAGRAAIRAFAPDIAVFDNAGRRGQLREARAIGARVVVVASRIRPRLKAFQLRRLTLADEIWFPYPEFIAGNLGRLERWKLRLPNAPRVRYLDYLLPRPAAQQAEVTLARAGVNGVPYVLVIAGGGGGHPGAEQAPAVYAAVASALANTGHTVLVLGAEPPLEGPGAVHYLGRVKPAAVAALLAKSLLVITNGGAALIQALGSGRAVVAAPIATDQGARIARCAERGAVLPAPLEAGPLARAALGVLEDPAARERLEQGARALGLVNGLATAVAAFEGLRSAPVSRSRRRH
jgi:hypothetical protein